MAGIVLVRDVMSKNVRVVQLDSSVKEVVATMNKFDIGSMIVVQGGRPVGIITERDILRRVVEPCVAPEILNARQVMTSPLVSIRETASIDEAAELMAKKKRAIIEPEKAIRRGEGKPLAQRISIPEKILENKELRKAVAEVGKKEGWKEREITILERVLDEVPDAEIAREVKLTRQRVGQIKFEMLEKLDRTARYHLRDHREKEPFYKQMFELEKEKRDQDVTCWNDVVMVMRDFLTTWEAHEQARARARLLEE